jgi:hypothetical protein
MKMGFIMQKIAQISKIAILFLCICFMSCVDSKNIITKQIPKTTSKTEFRKPFTAEMVGTSNGIIVNDDGSIIHIGEGEATLISKIIQPYFSTFHSGSMSYLYNEKAIFSEYRERVHVHFRLTMDGGETWSEWNDDLNILSLEGVMWDNEPDDRFVYLLSGSFPEKLYNGVQIKIVSKEINQGQKIIDILRFNFDRESTEWFEDRKRNREKAERKKNSKNSAK